MAMPAGINFPPTWTSSAKSSWRGWPATASRSPSSWWARTRPCRRTMPPCGRSRMRDMRSATTPSATSPGCIPIRPRKSTPRSRTRRSISKGPRAKSPAVSGDRDSAWARRPW